MRFSFQSYQCFNFYRNDQGFKGTFDGGHYTILNAKINGTALFEETENATYELIKEEAKKSLLKSKSVNKLGVELTYEVRIKDDNTGFVNKISACEGVTNAVLVSYNGEYMS